MGQLLASRRAVRRALAFSLSLLLVASAPLDAVLAYASENPGGGGAPQVGSKPEASVGNASNGAEPGDGMAEKTQINEQVALSGSTEANASGQEAGTSADGSGGPAKTVAGTGSDAASGGVAGADAPGSGGLASVGSGQAAAAVPLSPADAKASAGEIRADGLVYALNPDGATATLVSWHGTAPAGSVAVPSAVASGADSYAVTGVGLSAPETDEPAPGVLVGSQATSLSLPESVEHVAEGALSGCPSLKRVLVSAANERFASFDGMLFTKDLASLLSIPEGKEGACRLPDQTADVPLAAFSRAAGITAVEVGEGSAAFASRDGLLYGSDMKTLVACPPGAGEAVVLPAEVEAVAPGAFAGCEVASITALGFVRDIAADAFEDEAKGSAVVALPAGDDYDARRAVWEAAGFGRFAEPAAPGDVSVPEAPGGEGGPDGAQAAGLAYRVLDDYTLEVSWRGAGEGAAGDPAPGDGAAGAAAVPESLSVPAAAEVGGASYRVSAVAAGGFANLLSLRSVGLPASVATIGEGAFAGCANLASATLPEGLRKVGERAFEATALDEAWLPASVETVGERAFAGCGSLARVVALGSPEVAPDALAGCSGVAVYCPAGYEGAWNVGIPAAGNRLAPYGAEFPEEPLRLEVGQTASVFDGGVLQAPEPIEASYSYAAKPLSVDAQSNATGKAPGASEVSVALTLDGIELTRATRTVEVREAAEIEEVAISESGEPKAEFLGFGSLPMRGDAQVYQTVPLGTGRSFEQQVASGQILKFTVIEEDQASKTGRVEVSRSDDPANEPTGALVIPATVSESGMTYKVAAAAAKAFNEAWRVTSLSFEEGSELAAMYGNSFASMPSCRTIDIPHTTTTLDYGVFAYDTSLRFASIPDSVTTLGAQMFKQCTMLESVELGSGTRQLREETFSDCRSLTTIRVKGTVASIDAAAFLGVDTEGVTVYVPSEASKAAWIAAASKAGYAFKEPIVQADTCTVTFDAQGGCPLQQKTTVGKGSLVAEPGVPSKEGKSLAGWFTDPGCQEATRWEFSNPVTADMTLYAKWIGEVRDGDLVYRMRPDGASLAVAAVDPAGFSGILAIEESHEFDGEILPVKEIAPLGFSASQVETVVVPGSVEVIGADAFRLSEKLRSVEFGRGGSLTLIASDAFRQCSALEGICIPSSVSKMGRNVFEKCTSLSAVEFEPGSSLSVLESSAFSQCSSLETIDLPDHFSAIGSSAFDRCTSLKTIELPKMLSYIGGAAFARCASLELIDLCTVETIGPYAFSESGLASVTLPASVTYLGNKIFEKCPKLARAVVEAPISGIPYDTFNASALTSISLPSTVKSIDAHAFRSCDSITTIYADGSLGDAGVAAAFSEAVKTNAMVALPSMSADGTETFEEMKAVWQGYGFGVDNIIQASGTLPTGSNAEDGRWELASDGTLRIWCVREGAVIQDLGWTTWGPSHPTIFQNHWGPVRRAVRSVVVDESADATNMKFWFSTMSNLVDVSGVQVPKSVSSVEGMFAGSALVRSLPDTFLLHSEITNVASLFAECYGLETLPDNFNVPAKAVNLQSMFQSCRSLVALPANFNLPSAVDTCKLMFDDCRSLERLPEDFKLPQTVRANGFNNMFKNCSSLEMLPTGFTMGHCDETVDNLNGMFSGCTSLQNLPDDMQLAPFAKETIGVFSDCTSLSNLPEGFALPKTALNVDIAFRNCTSLASLPVSFEFPANSTYVNAFLIEKGPVVPMYYHGSDQRVINYPWTSSNRSFVSSDKPDNVKTVVFNVKTAGEAGPGSYWTTAYTNTSGMLAEPAHAPSRPGHVFTLWYADEACTQRVDFSKPFTGDATIYGVLAPGSQSGVLPMVNDEGNAFWSLTEDGTLFVRGFGGVVAELWPFDGRGWTEGDWGPYRSLVHKASLDPSLKVAAMTNWFRDMENLVDVSEAGIPESASILHGLFAGCASLETLPEGFAVPSKATNVALMFKGCTSLRSVPSSFKLSDAVSNASELFNGCTSLASLPQGFSIPESVSVMTSMFANCPMLTALPESFAFPSKVAEGSDAFRCDVPKGGARVATYYVGSSRSVLDFDWESQGRTLVTDEADMGEWGMRQVKFQVQKPDEAAGFPWETRSVAWTDRRGVLADVGAPQLDGYAFAGWCSDIACLEPVDFSQPLPEGVDTLYGKWLLPGDRGAVAGELPVESPDGSAAVPGMSAWWSITADGALNIKCEGGASVADLSMMWDDDESKCWEPYAMKVHSLNMHQDVKAKDMTSWFKRMGALVDVREGFFVPENCQVVTNLFYGDSNLRYLPTGLFSKCSQLKTMWGMLQGCTRLEELPADFSIPPSVDTIGCLFYNDRALKRLPESFKLHDGILYMKEAFFWCTSLQSLPQDLVIPSSVVSAAAAFANCSSLRELPLGLLSELSEEVKSSINDPHVSPSIDAVGMFGLGSGYVSGSLPTYFPAPEDQQLLIDWDAQRRTLVADPAASGQARVELWLPNKDGASFYLRESFMTAQGSKLDAPAAVPRLGAVFIGWYADDKLEKPYDFSAGTVPSEGLKLYAKYLATSGTLPTTDGRDSATWELSADGTLRIACQNGATIDRLGWKSAGAAPDFAESTWYDGYWGPIRDKVKRIEMDADVKATDMECWFAEMHELTDVSGVFIPEGVDSVQWLFLRCPLLETLPDGFAIPEGVTNTGYMFLYDSSLSALPAGFFLPGTVESTSNMLNWCTSLTALPAGFYLPGKLKNARGMFANCTALEALPETLLLPEGIQDTVSMFFGSGIRFLPSRFTIPKSVSEAQSMFSSCSSLTALPSGFTIPLDGDITNIDAMFHSCDNLLILPNGFDFPAESATGGDVKPGYLFITADGYAGPILDTYYSGPSERVKSLPWERWKRNLVDPSTGAHEDVRLITFEIRETGQAASEWMTVPATAGDDGKYRVVDPGIPSQYGYAFSDWLDESGGKFDFKSEITGNITLHCTKTLITKCDIPLTAKVTMDATGRVEPAPFPIHSLTPVPLLLKSVAVAEAPGAAVP